MDGKAFVEKWKAQGGEDPYKTSEDEGNDNI
jgi:hypothetical protein